MRLNVCPQFVLPVLKEKCTQLHCWSKIFTNIKSAKITQMLGEILALGSKSTKKTKQQQSKSDQTNTVAVSSQSCRC